MADVTPTEFDELDSAGVVARMLEAEARVVPALRAATGQIAAAAELVADRLAGGGRVAFVGAGTSGRLAVVEAAELPGTFGLPEWMVLARVAGGGPGGLVGSDWDEDDGAAAERDAADLALRPGDVLVAVAASGTTPYTLGVARIVAEAGVSVVAIVNATGSPLAALSPVPIEVPVGPEVLRGSTRLTAGTAQKMALNALTTTAMVRLGRVHGDLMIDVVAANAKLRQRARAIVAEIAGCSLPEAGAALERCGWSARAAVLALTFGLSAEQADERARRYATLRAAMSVAVTP